MCDATGDGTDGTGDDKGTNNGMGDWEGKGTGEGHITGEGFCDDTMLLCVTA